MNTINLYLFKIFAIYTYYECYIGFTYYTGLNTTVYLLAVVYILVYAITTLLINEYNNMHTAIT